MKVQEGVAVKVHDLISNNPSGIAPLACINNSNIIVNAQ